MSSNERQGDADFMRGVVQRIATGPTMSKDLPRDEARRAMRLILEGQADEIHAALFLIALRMKRETDAELAGVLDAIRQGMPRHGLSVDRLLVLADPYDGCLRGTPVSAFLPAVLAACGVRTLSHGVQAMGPKFGASHAAVLKAAGYAAARSLDDAARSLEDPGVGWAYLDQSIMAPELAGLTSLRTRIVKRPCLTTIESTLCPYEVEGTRHLLTGFVHTGYPEIYAALAREAGFASSIMVRGVEGTVVPSLAQASRYVLGDSGDALAVMEIDPADYGLAHQQRALPLPVLDAPVSQGARSVADAGNTEVAKIALEGAQQGMAALQGEAGMAHDALSYAAAVALCGLGVFSELATAVAQTRRVLDDGTVLKHFLGTKVTR